MAKANQFARDDPKVQRQVEDMVEKYHRNRGGRGKKSRR